MSDDDFMAEDEDFDFEYEDQSDEEPDADLENQYYNAKAQKQDKPEAALKLFRSVIAAQDQPSDWGFKSLKQMIKICYRLQRFDEVRTSNAGAGPLFGAADVYQIRRDPQL